MKINQAESQKKIEINLKDVVGRGYGTFWNFKGRYRFVKGSRASKKSKTTALWYIVNMMKYPKANTLVIRKTYRTLKDSCFSDLLWAINRLQVGEHWTSKTNPLEITYRPTGQKILFRGLDDPLKLASISVPNDGYLCWCWIEEAYEIMDESDFDIIDESIRGAIPEDTGLFKQITLTMNPWNERHWTKKRFFDEDSDDILALTTNYMCNEWLDESDRRVFEEMKERNPARYRVAGLGEWGVTDGLVYENWTVEPFDINSIKQQKGVKASFGLDWGYTTDPSALVCLLIDRTAKTIWIFDEIYEKGLTNERLAELIIEAGYGKEQIIADASEPKSIDRLKSLGIGRIRRAKKGKDSIRAGIDFLQDYRIIVHPRCVGTITELSNYAWKKDASGKSTGKPEDTMNHAMDALRYATEPTWNGGTVKIYKKRRGLR